MKLWVKKLLRFRGRAARTPFDRGSFYREKALRHARGVDPNLSWPERVMKGYQEGRRRQEERHLPPAPHMLLKGWRLSMGREDGNRPHAPAKWHLIAMAEPYRRPITAGDYTLLAEILTELCVPLEVVEEEVAHWGVDVPFAPLHFCWSVMEKKTFDPRQIASFLHGFYGWHEDVSAFVQEMRERVVALTPEEAYDPSGLQEILESASWTARPEGGVDLEVPVDEVTLATISTLPMERALVNGWTVVYARWWDGAGVLRSHLSMKLFPFGRGSNKLDWRVFGQIAGAMGVPDIHENLLTPLDSTHPNDTHHFHWKEDEREVVAASEQATQGAGPGHVG